MRVGGDGTRSRAVPEAGPRLARVPAWLLGAAFGLLAMATRTALDPWLLDALPLALAYPAVAAAAYLAGPTAAVSAMLVVLGWAWAPVLPVTVVGRPGLIQSVTLVFGGLLMIFAVELVRRVADATSVPPPDAPATGPPRTSRLHLLSLVLAAVLPMLFASLLAWRSYEAAFADADTATSRLARIAHEQASRVIETDAAIAYAVLQTFGSEDDGHLRAQRDAVQRKLREIIVNMPQIAGVGLWDRDGRLLASSAAPSDPLLQIADREYFRALRDGRVSTYLSGPLRSRTTHEDTFVFAQARRTAAGDFDGVATVSMLPDYFVGFYRALASEAPGLKVQLLRDDGLVVVAWPEPAGVRLPEGSPLLAAVRAGRSAGTVDSGAGHASRHTAFRGVGTFPIYVSASLDRDDVITGWYRQIAVIGGIGVPVMMLLVLAAWAALRRTRQQQLMLVALQQETQRRARAESALHEAQRMEALGRLTGIVAHDFNNLLMVVNNNMHVMRRLLPGAAESAQLDAIGRAVAAGERLTRQLLSVSPRKVLRPELVRLQDRLPAMRELLRSTVGAKVEVEIRVAADTAPIEVDPTELELAMLNLAINARDAMPGGGTLTVVAGNADARRSALDAPGVQIEVGDTGRGIPADIIGKVFEPLFTTKPRGKGTGLGLSQVHSLAVQAGGTARARSTEGEGTTITLEFPRASARAVAPPAAATETGTLSGRILLVEDNPDVAAATLPLLQTMGCVVTHVPHASAAMALLSGAAPGSFDIVLSDIVMPGTMSGVDLAAWLREHREGLPIVLMTGYASEVDSAVARGFTVLQKPVSPATLFGALSQSGLVVAG